MSYELDVIVAQGVVDLAALARSVAVRSPDLEPRVANGRIVVDGAGFAVERSAAAVRLVAGPQRSERDERAMEIAASVLAGGTNEVIDRHTGRHWPAPVLDAWLRVTGLLSGRALAVNEERIAHSAAPTAAREFAARVEAITTHVSAADAPELRRKVVDELLHCGSRPALVWPVARGLARLGDLSRLADLSRDADEEKRSEAFGVAADLGGDALALFESAFDDADPNRRRTAAKMLHRVRDRRVLPLVVRALDDRRSTVREAVLESEFERLLALEGGPGVLGPALARRSSDPNAIVRKLAARFR